MNTENSLESVEGTPPQVLATNRPAQSASLVQRVTSFLPLIVFALLWLDLLRLLSYQWEAREQYSYGWLVPFFAAALFWKRWQDRPAPEAGRIPVWVTALLISTCLLIIPSRVVYEINPDWPLVSWVHTACVVLVTLYLLLAAGGCRWVKHFFFPVAFIFVAVVWPYRIEKGLTQGLMHVVASLTVELLGWFGIAAVERGNLIEISTGVLGVDEACSGIRSFQSSIMAGLFMGELYRLRLWARGSLLIVGALLAFCFNVGRTFWLSYQANSEGMEAVDKYHDAAGMTILMACFFCLWALAVLVRRWSGANLKDEISTTPMSPAPAWRPWAYGIGCWALLSLGATQAWYKAHEVDTPGVFHWSVDPPEQKPAFVEIELPQRTLDLLSYSTGSSSKWQESDGSSWTMFFFRWNPTSIKNMIGARIHRPEVCLPAAGMKLADNLGLEYIEVHGLRLPFRTYVYDMEGKPLYVFFCQWEDGNQKQMGLWGDDTRHAERLRSALAGRRHLGQQTLQVLIAGPKDVASAKQSFKDSLPSLIRIDER